MNKYVDDVDSPLFLFKKICKKNDFIIRNAYFMNANISCNVDEIFFQKDMTDSRKLQIAL